ncbi:substrate-binding domain-containing protein [Fodinicola feengrottensis]|uniref:substrate-binding domain-containing protein n=1 Tax=Fodinicola feengrottensis TaxID=435914 RepID=UPI002442C1E3|nr:substrate-binding domain-containing protein [Fodinicola feengrottensis]
MARFQRGVDAAVTAAGVESHLVQPLERTRSGARAAVAAALEAAGEDCGLVVPNTVAVPHVLRALAAAGRRPGRDVSVVGVCTDAAAESMEPAVTNVSLEPRDVSRRAMRTLFALLDPDVGGPPPSGVELVVPRLTRRETTGGGATP